MKDKIVAKIKIPFEKIGSVVFDRVKTVSIARLGVETSVLLVIILILAIL